MSRAPPVGRTGNRQDPVGQGARPRPRAGTIPALGPWLGVPPGVPLGLRNPQFVPYREAAIQDLLNTELNYYERFLVSPRSTQSEIEEVFKNWSLMIHPDVVGSITPSQAVRDIYGILGDYNNRRKYDAALRTSALPKHFSKLPDDVVRQRRTGNFSIDPYVVYKTGVYASADFPFDHRVPRERWTREYVRSDRGEPTAAAAAQAPPPARPAQPAQPPPAAQPVPPRRPGAPFTAAPQAPPAPKKSPTRKPPRSPPRAQAAQPPPTARRAGAPFTAAPQPGPPPAAFRPTQGTYADAARATSRDATPEEKAAHAHKYTDFGTELPSAIVTTPPLPPPRLNDTTRTFSVTLEQLTRLTIVEVPYTRPTTDGRGQVTMQTLNLRVTVYPGTPDGTSYRYEGLGALPGYDLVLVLHTLPNSTFTRQGSDLRLNQPVVVSVWAALLKRVRLDMYDIYGNHLDNPVLVVVTDGQELKLPNAGLPVYGTSNAKGRLIVPFKTFTPSYPTPEQREVEAKMAAASRM